MMEREQFKKSKDFKVIPINSTLTKEWLLYKHYAKRMPVITYAFGLYDKNVLLGVCTFGRPASVQLCKGICGAAHKDIVFELNRLCVNDGLPKNITSFFVSRCLKLMPKNLIIVSFADTEQGHLGIIYQATNFFYTGLTDKHKEWRIKGENIHSKNVCKAFTLDERKANPNKFEHIDRPRKHRYIYFLGNKSFQTKMNKLLKYPVLPYPKGKTSRYDASHKTIVQLRLVV